MSFHIVKLTDPLNPTIITGGLVPRGAYNAGTDYAVGDSVDYNGSSYVMYVDAGAGTLPTDTTKWQVLANKGSTGATGATGATGSTGAAGVINQVKNATTNVTQRGNLNFSTGLQAVDNGGTVSTDVSIDTSVTVDKTTTQTLTNKRITKRVVTTNAPGGTPSTNTDNGDIFEFTGLAAAITSMTTNLSGTPVNGDMVQFSFVDNGTPRAITWGASFAASTVALPTTTVTSTVLRVLFQYQTIATLNKWVCIASI